MPAPCWSPSSPSSCFRVTHIRLPSLTCKWRRNFPLFLPSSTPQFCQYNTDIHACPCLLLRSHTQRRIWDQTAALPIEEFYPAVKRKATMACAGKQIQLRITVLNEISQTREDKYVFSHHGISLGFASSIFLHHLPTQSHGQLSITLVSLSPSELMGYVNIFPERATLRLPAGYPPSFINLPHISNCKPQLGPASLRSGTRGCLIPLQSVTCHPQPSGLSSSESSHTHSHNTPMNLGFSFFQPALSPCCR